jgi:hypothetical protein
MKLWFGWTAVLVAGSLMHDAPALGQSDGGKLPKVPVGAVAAHLTGRLTGGGGLDGEYEMICYVTFLEGLGVAVYSGEPAERNAKFTLRTDRFRFRTIQNGTLVHFGRLAEAGSATPAIRVYYNNSPNRDSLRPGTYSDGQLIAVFRIRAIQGNLTAALMFRAEGSSALESSSEFMLGDRAVNLKTIGEGITVTLSGVPPSLTEFTGSSSLSVPFSGTIVAAKKFQ